MCHTPEPYVKYFKLLKRVLPPNRVNYDFHLKMDGGWVRMKDEKRNHIFIGKNARVTIGGKEVGYVTNVKYQTVDTVNPIKVLNED